MLTFFKFRLSGGRYRLNGADGAWWPEGEEYDLRTEDQVLTRCSEYGGNFDILGIYECEFVDDGDLVCQNVTADIADKLWKQMRSDYSDGDPLPKLVMDHVDWQSDVEEMERDGAELAAHEREMSSHSRYL